MWGAIIPSIIGGVSSIVSSGKQAKAANKAAEANDKLAEGLLSQQKEAFNEEKKRFNSDYYGDYMNRDSIKNMMNRFRETYQRGNQSAANRAAMSGASEAQTNGVIAQNYKNLADTAGSIAAQGDAYKSNALSRYERANSNYFNALGAYNKYKMGVNSGKAQNSGNQWANFSSLAGNLVSKATSSFLGDFTKTKTKTDSSGSNTESLKVGQPLDTDYIA